MAEGDGTHERKEIRVAELAFFEIVLWAYLILLLRAASEITLVAKVSRIVWNTRDD